MNQMQKIKVRTETVSDSRSIRQKIFNAIRTNELLRFVACVIFYGILISLMLTGLFIRTPWLWINIVSKIIGWGIVYWILAEELPDIYWRYRRR